MSACACLRHDGRSEAVMYDGHYRLRGGRKHLKTPLTNIHTQSMSLPSCTGSICFKGQLEMFLLNTSLSLHSVPVSPLLAYRSLSSKTSDPWTLLKLLKGHALEAQKPVMEYFNYTVLYSYQVGVLVPQLVCTGCSIMQHQCSQTNHFASILPK